MIATQKLSHLQTSPVDGTDRLGDDAFGADEGGVRWDLVSRVRTAIETGEYDEEDRIDTLIDRLTIDLDL